MVINWKCELLNKKKICFNFNFTGEEVEKETNDLYVIFKSDDSGVGLNSCSRLKPEDLFLINFRIDGTLFAQIDCNQIPLGFTSETQEKDKIIFKLEKIEGNVIFDLLNLQIQLKLNLRDFQTICGSSNDISETSWFPSTND